MIIFDAYTTKLHSEMRHEKLEIDYQVFSSIDELEPLDRELALEAIKAQTGSYAPYSGYNVGSAIRLTSGRIITGSNQENNASPAGLCAERTAMFYAHAHWPDEPMEEIAIAGGPGFTLDDEPATPCGQCRQVMAEFQTAGKHPLAILMVGKKEIWKFGKVDDILPFIFDGYKPK